MAAVCAALLEQHALGAGGVDGYVGQHGERLAAYLGGGADADLGGVGVVRIPRTCADEVRPPPRHGFKDVQIGERQPVVLVGL